MTKKKTYFLSDFHLGVEGKTSSQERERLLAKWMLEHKDMMEALYLCGDVFDYWFEYREAIPKGYVRFLSALAHLRDSGIPIYFFTGNHDMWMFKYLENELGITIYREPKVINIYGKSILVGHGDGLGPSDFGYKFIKKIFSNKLCQWAFARIHPNTGIAIMRYLSGKKDRVNNVEKFMGPKKEWLIIYCEELLKQGKVHDYFIFGHRHIPVTYILSNGKSQYINLGDWLQYYTYYELSEYGGVLKYYRK